MKQGTVRPLAANERVVRDNDGRLQIERLPEPDFHIPAVLASLEKAIQYLPDHIDGEFNSALSVVKRLLESPPSVSQSETPKLSELLLDTVRYGSRDERDEAAKDLLELFRQQQEEIERLKEDGELLDWVDTLPSGACILGDTAHPQSMCMTPKAQGFSHTRQLIRDARESRLRSISDSDPK